MKVVYVAGPFTAPTAWGIECNVRAAEVVGLEIAKMGFAPLIPHANTRFFHGTCAPEFWYRATEALLLKCDAAFFLPTWANSHGCRHELAAAQSAKIPCLFALEDLRHWGTRARVICGSQCPVNLRATCEREAGPHKTCEGHDPTGLLLLWDNHGSSAAAGR